MIEDPDVYRAAAVLIKQHGDEARSIVALTRSLFGNVSMPYATLHRTHHTDRDSCDPWITYGGRSPL